MDINKSYNESNLETMAKMPDCFVDLTVTSPPYDGLRTYNGYSFPFEDIAKELFRITKQGGILVWIVGDGHEKGGETLTSFKQALFFKEIGFIVHDTIIYKKNNFSVPFPDKYHQTFEYCFILSKGKKKTFNPICDRKNKKAGQSGGVQSITEKDGTRSKRSAKIINDYGKRHNVWEYDTGMYLSTKDKFAFNHPAIFPEELVKDHIISWSNEGDLVYDPFMGSGTTAKMSILNNRNWIGSEISSEYCTIIEERIKKALEEKRKEKDLQAGTLFGNEM
ncbi:MAG: site-specific DNA-methyltransferase [Saprospiraceae bacterium]|nr:site-specific DNA-methyltransferase [Saprospiraceae bacterium]